MPKPRIQILALDRSVIVGEEVERLRMPDIPWE